MKNNLILEISHLLLKNTLSKDDVIIDATMGNGSDTLFLANHVKFVYAFDIQEIALIETAHKLDKLPIKNVQLILDTHENFSKYVTNFNGAVFNLGYLPKGDKSITTKKDSTIHTIDHMLTLLPTGGFIQIIVYQGHLEGQSESLALSSYLEKLNNLIYKILKVDLPYQDNNPPYMIMIYKIKDESN